ncbi:hypothetical protein [Deinococcus sp. QL22]|uniref:hypothetical protein n=1 Tax=Deinococcus sp. QL22 TaxID=2939437 RepID=UPI002016E4B6|nr:hypothetical protein [Deinococcus sp. QL22]UQN09494.1 hypothetical protein M1R55_23385 [Deinococcus sp. QL22]
MVRPLVGLLEDMVTAGIKAAYPLAVKRKEYRTAPASLTPSVRLNAQDRFTGFASSDKVNRGQSKS